ncbi:hypothetical protein Taro_039908 [Colocasia esculenta]|uniref:Uncharacterized protein n=1 Tax=Colocasia esculenta TaxID=4460 RepID=A0A843W7M2_COLES|nr:hypothetical protein [Colocasia esculenta]
MGVFGSLDSGKPARCCFLSSFCSSGASEKTDDPDLISLQPKETIEPSILLTPLPTLLDPVINKTRSAASHATSPSDGSAPAGL